MVAIFVLALFLLIILVDLIVLKIQGKNHPAFEPLPTGPDYSIPGLSNITIPTNTFFSKGHTWLKKNKDGLIDVGIDAFGTTALGALTISRCAEEGKEIKKGEVIFEGCFGNKSIKFLSPVNGIVKAVNTNIMGKKISNPYDTWGVKLTSKDISENKEQFLSGSEAFNWMKKEYIRLKNFIEIHALKAELVGATMYDGGLAAADISSSLIERSAKDFENEFLSL